MTRARGFTLIEMLIATLLAAILMGGVLSMSAALARDQKRLSTQSRLNTDGIVELFRFDLSNARSITQSSDGQVLMLVGHGGLDRRTLEPTNRLSRVSYRIDGQTGVLRRIQEYIDDPARPTPWSELVASDVARIDVTFVSGDTDIVPEPALGSTFSQRGARRIGDITLAPESPASVTLPTRVRLRVASSAMPIDQEVWVR